MKAIWGVAVILTAFIVGFVSASLTAVDNVEQPLSFIIPTSSSDVASPQDWIAEDNIHVYDNSVVIDIQNPEWARFTDTNSMDPVFDYGSNAIEIVPSKPEQIDIGDIVSYKSRYSTGTIIHRVVELGEDEDGWFATLKGDNNPYKDPEKVRFAQIQRVVVAIIY